jgi:hypothetical protein
MSNKLLPLAQIPTTTARNVERKARATFASRSEALEAATHEIVVAPGCHSRPYFDPPRVGWCLTQEAADAVVAQVTVMPDGNHHRRMTWRKY